MEPKWAEENLQTIRTLMERSTIYRRALAPIMLFAGALGVAAAAIGLLFHLDSSRQFGVLWLCTAAVVVVGAFLIARRQAIKDHENFWSPPTRRVAQALLPAFISGLCLSVLQLLHEADPEVPKFIALIWIIFYGLALHAAGFFMPRGIKLFGWAFMISSLSLFYILGFFQINFDLSAHWLMGFFFGVLQLAYGAYLYLTENGKNAA